MASVFHLYNDAFNIKRDIVTKYSEYAESDKKLYFSAVRIQSCWRGYRVRKRIQLWNEKALIITKYARGFLLRRRLPEILHKRYLEYKAKFYNVQATKIQAFWRGYKWRRDNFTIKQIRAQREELDRITEQMKRDMEEVFRAQSMATSKSSAESSTEGMHLALIDEVLRILSSKHHLLRTWHREGVLSIHGSNKLSILEEIMRGMSFKKYIDKKHHNLVKKNEMLPDINSNKQTQGQGFNLNTKVKPKPYERMLLTQN